MARKKEGEAYKQMPRGHAKQVGSSLAYHTSTSVYGFLGHPEYMRLVEYERAMETDETVGTGIEFIKLSILASLGEYSHPNPKIRDFVIENLVRMEGNYKMALGELITSALWSGFGVTEVVYKAEEGHIWFDYLANYNPKTVHLQVNAKGRLTEGEAAPFNAAYTTGIWQDQFGGAPIRLPMNRTVLVSHNKKYNNYYGQSAIKRIYKNWRLKEATLEMWNVALDRYGTPVTYAIVPNGFTGNEIPDPTSETGKRPERIADSTAGAISQIHTGTGLVIERPSPTDDIELGTLTTGNNFGDSFVEAIRYYNTAIYRGLLIPQLLLQDQGSGSLGGSAIASVHFDVFKLMLSALYEEIVEPFVEQALGRLVMINFGDKNPGKFEMSPYDAATTELLSNVFLNLVNIGALDMTDIGDLNLIRAKVGLPPLTSKQGKRLTEINHNKLLTADHMGDEVVDVKTVTHDPNPRAIAGGGAGGASKPGASKPGTAGPAPKPVINKAPKPTTTVTQQTVKKAIPLPPPPAGKTSNSSDTRQNPGRANRPRPNRPKPTNP